MTKLGHKFGLTTPKARITNFRHNASSTMMIKMQHCTYIHVQKPCFELTFTNGSKTLLEKTARKKENKPNFGVGGAIRKMDPAPLSQQLDTKNYPCVLFIGKISDQIPLSLC